MNEKYKQFLHLNFYQIYPKSFMDSNNDGIGDFKGITQKIPYLVELGINAVWLSPCFKSPNVDSGYDICDYTDVGEEFGTLDDFKEMLNCFHSYGIKVIIDLVVNHCSTEHTWFKEAKKSRDNPYHDYFYWYDEKPNDWDACFGGSAWQWEESVKQYYLHSFAVEQADLNWENPKVREEVKNIIDFWVDLGVDGFRCDVLDMISKDIAAGVNSCGPRLHEFINEIFGREKTKHLYTIGECWNVNEEKIKDLTAAERGELTTSFISGNIADSNRRFYLPEEWDYDIIHRHLSKYQVMYEKNDLIFAPYFENHDQCRCVSKFADDRKLRFESATFFATILYTLKGTPFILQGQEFGTTDAYYDSIDYFDDAHTIGFYNSVKDKMSEEELIQLINKDSRDNGRHPMTWNSDINGGFNSGAKPWLPIHSRVDEINLECDRNSNKSIFEYFKKLIALRKSSDTLIYGDFEDMTGERKDCFIYTRTYGDEKIAVICNYNKASVIDVPENYEKITGNYDGENNGVFRPFEAVIYKVRNTH